MTRAVRLTPAEAKALGLDVPVRRTKASRALVPAADCLAVVCHVCGQEMTTDEAMSRHTTEVGHLRYDVVLPGKARA